jgi:15-cis-phytoene synthase
LSDSNENYRLCGEALHESDRDRWLAAMFAPDAVRPHLFALYAFNAEVARIREQVSQPILGEMRLQWWIEVLKGERDGEAAANPTAAALLETLEKCALPREKLLDLLEARRFDFYEEPVPDQAFLDKYCEETCSVLFDLASRIFGGDGAPEASAPAGRAYALTGLLRALPWHVARRQCYAPADLLARHGATQVDVLARAETGAVKAALAEWRAMARKNLAEAKQAVLALPKPAREAFRLLALLELYLRQMEQRDYDPFSTRIEVAPWRRQWALWRNKN